MTVTYKNQTHMKIYMNYVLLSPYKQTNEFLAAVYFLSADKELWSCAKKAISEKKIDFENIDKNSLSCCANTLLRLAQDISEGTNHISIHDIGDPYLISAKTCELILNAVGICRYGYRVLGINKQFN